MLSSDTICIVIPCYNEELRLDITAFEEHASKHENISFIFVDDGSGDNTAELLSKACAYNNQLSLVSLDKNSGKAVAVRHGLLSAIDKGYDFIGYWDADLSTPLEEINRLHQVFQDETIDVAIGSRVKMLGYQIERQLLRHLAGRIYATAASIALNLPIYDTQCGAKLFRCNDKLNIVLSQPFISNWTFDVEIIRRYMICSPSHPACSNMVEVPLNSWIDRAGSKVKGRDFFIALYSLSKITNHYNKTSILSQFRLDTSDSP